MWGWDQIPFRWVSPTKGENSQESGALFPKQWLNPGLLAN